MESIQAICRADIKADAAIAKAYGEG